MPFKEKKEKLLIIQTAFLGDAILATGVVEFLHAAKPSAEIHILVRAGHESLFHEHPFLARVWVWHKKRKKIKNLIELAKNVRREKFDAVINLHRFASSGIITALSGARGKYGFRKNPLSRLFTAAVPHLIGKAGDISFLHENDRNISVARLYTQGALAKPRLYPTELNYLKVKPLQGEPYITIAPASVWFTKMWPAEKWSQLITEHLSEYPIHIIGAKGDEELANRIISASPQLCISNLCGELGFLDTAALMQGAKMNFVNDSGPLHIASAVNAPVTAVFCSTVPEFGFGPLSDTSYVAQITRDLPCRPCGLHGYRQCPEGHFKCALEIEVSQLASFVPSQGQKEP